MAREPYRAPSRPREPPRPAPPANELDQAAFERTESARRTRHRAEMDRGRKLDVDGTAFWVRARGAAIVALALPAGALGWAADFHGRGGARIALVAPALLLTGLFLLLFGAGGAPSYAEAPTWIKAGTAIAACVGLAIGFVLLFR